MPQLFFLSPASRVLHLGWRDIRSVHSSPGSLKTQISVGFGIAIVLYLIAGVMIWMCVRQRENKNNHSANTNFNTNAITSANTLVNPRVNTRVSRGADHNGGKGGKNREARIEYRQTEKLPLTTETESVE